MKIRILIADNHTLFREGLRTLASKEPDLEVVGEAQDGREAVALARKLHPDVVVMDVVMPELNGLEATRQIRGEDTRVRVIGLSMHTDKRYVLGMLEAGASGYLAKDSPFEEVARALRAVAGGHVYLAPNVAGLVVEDFARRAASPSGGPARELSPREREVLQLLAEGKSARAIAHGLHVSVKTVETHRRNIMARLGLDSVAALTRYAIREGITSLDLPPGER
mgnify:CR=1 FL=1